ncbi:helix-turn-helix domain-containing protein [Actinoplanes sp. CA-051413]|uniref:helix-turn-helix domain-containing protein n=1 Tax=Actinoplanes sp. CA-051413 TaxID=3239899 RepID=UPI003D96B633
MTMTLASTHSQPDDWDSHLCACRLPPPPQRRAIRQAAHMSLSHAASRLGVDTMTLSRWERGLHEPRPRYIPAYLDLLDHLRAQAVKHTPARTQK